MTSEFFRPEKPPAPDQVQLAFEAWCSRHRGLLGRDRLRPAFEAGYRAGFEAGHAEQEADDEHAV